MDINSYVGVRIVPLRLILSSIDSLDFGIRYFDHYLLISWRGSSSGSSESYKFGDFPKIIPFFYSFGRIMPFADKSQLNSDNIRLRPHNHSQ